ncbi:MAG: 2-amino-4-hydroxy-6-hydroxymethyldihydropteridine diphosphokinase [Planctomycetota bacterium]|jgi:2-amino-4-hydroxy-6-hydroxymethyldihydropteridine diphosphokinase
MTDAMAYIALGSNLGDRRRLLESALDALREIEGVEVVAVSDHLETEPQGPPGQHPYLNAAAALRCRIAPRPLLTALLAIEAAHGRDRTGEQRWGPRPLDLDLLLYGDQVIDDPDLVVPHPRLHKRPFVLVPLAQIAPDAMHPVLGLTVRSLRDRLPGACGV